MDSAILRCYAVTDHQWIEGEELTQQVQRIVKAGVTCVQLRAKKLNKKLFLKQALALREVTKRLGVPFIINDDLSICYQSGADGVHLGQQDEKVSTARQLLGVNKLIGVSARTVGQAQQAERDGADYIGSGAVFGSTTKQNATWLGIESLHQICCATSLPVVAIGGITQDNMDQLKGSGIAGVAVVSAIFGASDIVQATKDLCEKINRVI